MHVSLLALSLTVICAAAPLPTNTQTLAFPWMCENVTTQLQGSELMMLRGGWLVLSQNNPLSTRSTCCGYKLQIHTNNSIVLKWTPHNNPVPRMIIIAPYKRNAPQIYQLAHKLRVRTLLAIFSSESPNNSTTCGPQEQSYQNVILLHSISHIDKQLEYICSYLNGGKKKGSSSRQISSLQHDQDIPIEDSPVFYSKNFLYDMRYGIPPFVK